MLKVYRFECSQVFGTGLISATANKKKEFFLSTLSTLPPHDQPYFCALMNSIKNLPLPLPPPHDQPYFCAFMNSLSIKKFFLPSVCTSSNNTLDC